MERNWETARIEHERDPLCRRILREHITWLDRRIAKLETRGRELIASQPEATALVTRFRLVKSVGLTTAITVLVEAPELGTLGPKRAASLAGLAPIPDDSGHYKGVRRIQRGRFMLRRALYMCALVAAYHNPILRVFYQRLIAAGKKPKLALVAVMRKIIVLLDLIAGDPAFIPQPTPAQT
jgi:transposase